MEYKFVTVEAENVNDLSESQKEQWYSLPTNLQTADTLKKFLVTKKILVKSKIDVQKEQVSKRISDIDETLCILEGHRQALKELYARVASGSCKDINVRAEIAIPDTPISITLQRD